MTSTTDPLGRAGILTETDTYTFYGDANETIMLGSFKVTNGISTEAEANSLNLMTKTVYDTNGDGIVDDSTRLGGKTLEQIETERTQEIREAALALGTSYTVADIAARTALTNLVVGDNVFVADDGDTKWAQYWVTEVTDGLGSTSTFEVVMDEDTYLNANTKESIKITYESNADTNAYTDAEKLKVDVGTVLTTTATTLPHAINEHEADIGNMLLNTTATNLTGAVNEVHSELDTHVNNDGSAHSFINQDVKTTATPTFAGIVTSGLLDGRDVSVDGAKLDTIESGATADQVASEVPVTATGNLTSVNVQLALEELQQEIDGIKTIVEW